MSSLIFYNSIIKQLIIIFKFWSNCFCHEISKKNLIGLGLKGTNFVKIV